MAQRVIGLVLVVAVVAFAATGACAAAVAAVLVWAAGQIAEHRGRIGS